MGGGCRLGGGAPFLGGSLASPLQVRVLPPPCHLLLPDGGCWSLCLKGPGQSPGPWLNTVSGVGRSAVSHSGDLSGCGRCPLVLCRHHCLAEGGTHGTGFKEQLPQTSTFHHPIQHLLKLSGIPFLALSTDIFGFQHCANNLFIYL